MNAVAGTASLSQSAFRQCPRQPVDVISAGWRNARSFTNHDPASVGGESGCSPHLQQISCALLCNTRLTFPLEQVAAQREGRVYCRHLIVCRLPRHYDPWRVSVSSAGKPQSSSAATASSTTNAAESPDTVTVLFSLSNSRFATPGSDCNVDLTVARHPPQCMSGHENLTNATVFTALVVDESVSAAVGTAACSPAHPADKTSAVHSMYLRMVCSCK